MASFRTFKTTYKDRKGKTKEASRWYVEFRDHRDQVRRLPAFTSKVASEEMGRNLVRLVEYHKGSGGQTDPALMTWLAGLPMKTREKLVSIGLIPSERASAAKPLSVHLEDFETALKAKGTSEKQVGQVVSRTKKVVEGCGFRFVSEISAGKVQAFLNDLRRDREGERGISNQTYNFYLSAIKHFCKWLTKERRALESPVAHLSGLNVRLDRRHDRQTLSPAKLGFILQAALGSEKTFRGLTGRDRHYLYLLAMSSGFRSDELASLHPELFQLDAEPPLVTVSAAYSKNKRTSIQPLPPDVAEALREYLAEKPKGEPIWPGTWHERAAAMLRIDLEGATALMRKDDPGSAGIPYVIDGPDGPLYADFHSLRHSYIAMLDQAGLTLKQAMQLARHSDPRLTMARYGRAQLHDLGSALENMPAILPATSDPQEVRMTGTDGRKICQDNPPAKSEKKPVLAFCLARKERLSETSVDSDGRNPDKGGMSEVIGEQEEVTEKTGKSELRLAGVEPATFGSVDRCNHAINASFTGISDNPENVLAHCLALLQEKSPDLALVVERWEALPEAVRAGIVAMVKASGGLSQERG